MKETISLILVLVLCLSLCACREETEDGMRKYGSLLEAENAMGYVSGLLGAEERKYSHINDDSEGVDLLLDSENEIRDTDWLVRTVDFPDGTGMTLPCTYSELKDWGWEAKNEGNTSFADDNICLQNSEGKTLIVSKAQSPDAPIRRVRIPCGEFQKCYDQDTRQDYLRCQKSGCYPEFEYVGLGREATPAQFIQQLGFPRDVKCCTGPALDGRLEFEYHSYDYDHDEFTIARIVWYVFEDGSTVMDYFELQRIAIYEWSFN